MLNDFTGADKVYIACGYTDLRKGIDGLARMVQKQFELDPFTNTLFLFCGRRRDRIKDLYWEKDGYILLYKRLEQGAYQWPRSESEARSLTPQQLIYSVNGSPYFSTSRSAAFSSPSRYRRYAVSSEIMFAASLCVFYAGIRGFFRVRRERPRSPDAGHAGNAPLGTGLVDTPFRHAPAVRCLPYGDGTLDPVHAAPPRKYSSAEYIIYEYPKLRKRRHEGGNRR